MQRTTDTSTSDPPDGFQPPSDTGVTPPDDTNTGIDTAPQCTGGRTMCGMQCVDTNQSDRHCGQCGNNCGNQRQCVSGACQCPTGRSWCGGACIDTSSDSQNCGSCGNTCPGGEVCSGGACGPNENVAGIISETNKVRSTKTDCGQYGELSKAPPLTGNAELHKAAQRHADDMVMNNFFSHTGSDGSSFSSRIGDTNYRGRPVGENIAAGNSTPAATVAQWEDSDGHCRNMMNSGANEIGVGVARGGRYGWYWVQVFGRQ